MYILLPEKSSVCYRKMWQVIRQLCSDSNSQYLIDDFERAAINTFKEVWQMTFIKGCFFHIAQFVHRKIQNLGLKPLYSNNVELSLIIRMLLSRRRWSSTVIGPGGPSMAAVNGPPTNISSNVLVVLFMHFYVVSINLLDTTVSDMNSLKLI